MIYLTTGEELTSVADAIREKTGKPGELKYPEEFVSEIESIQTGGDPTLEDDYCGARFFDFNGNLIAAIPAEEIADLTELPALPDHSDIGLTNGEWSWSLQEIKDFFEYYKYVDPACNVSALYDSTAQFVIGINVPHDNYDVYLWLTQGSENVDVNIAWGDGYYSSESPLISRTSILHTYATKGKYYITVTSPSNLVIPADFPQPFLSVKNEWTRKSLAEGNALFTGIMFASLMPSLATTMNYCECDFISFKKGASFPSLQSFGNYSKIKYFGYLSYNGANNNFLFQSEIKFIDPYPVSGYNLNNISTPLYAVKYSVNAFSCNFGDNIHIKRIFPQFRATSIQQYSAKNTFDRAFNVKFKVPPGLSDIRCQIYNLTKIFDLIIIPKHFTQFYNYAYSNANVHNLIFEEKTAPTFTSGMYIGHTSNIYIYYDIYNSMITNLNNANDNLKATNNNIYGWGEFDENEVLPSSNSDNLNLTWFNSIDECIQGLNPITIAPKTGRYYCTFSAP